MMKLMNVRFEHILQWQLREHTDRSEPLAAAGGEGVLASHCERGRLGAGAGNGEGARATQSQIGSASRRSPHCRGDAAFAGSFFCYIYAICALWGAALEQRTVAIGFKQQGMLDEQAVDHSADVAGTYSVHHPNQHRRSTCGTGHFGTSNASNSVLLVRREPPMDADRSALAPKHSVEDISSGPALVAGKATRGGLLLGTLRL